MDQVATTPEMISDNGYSIVQYRKISTLLALYIYGGGLNSLLVVKERVKLVEYVSAYRRRRRLCGSRDLVRGGGVG